VNHLRQILEQDSSEEAEKPGRLDRAALELATIQFPGLQPEPYLDQLNDLASRLGDRLRNFNDGRDFVETAQRYLFGELGYHGYEKDEDHFDPRNSCLNHALEQRTGLPITLSVMYMEIARRLHMPVFGIGLPNHFVIQFDDGNYSTFIDPFHNGRVITALECFTLARARVVDPALLRRVGKKQIVMRMLQNLYLAYRHTRDPDRAVATLDLMISGAPETAPWYKHRGAFNVELKRWPAARRDFEKYLAMEPEAEDRAEVLKQLQAIQRWTARYN
jgi:regulator of sirC expression with transglutaminase-like and TPR domain